MSNIKRVCSEDSLFLVVHLHRVCGVRVSVSIQPHSSHTGHLSLSQQPARCALQNYDYFAPVRCSTAPGRGNRVLKNTAIKTFNFRGPRKLLDQGPSKQNSSFQHCGQRHINNVPPTARETFRGKTERRPTNICFPTAIFCLSKHAFF